MHINYHFPKVTLYLDAKSLELDDRCKKALDLVRNKKDEASLDDFQKYYGHFIVTNVQLGGKLFASKDFTETTASSKTDIAKSMEVSAEASFSYEGASADTSLSHKTRDTQNSSKESSQSSTSISWQAVGGDADRCNDPKAWRPTTRPFRNWAVIKQGEITSIAEFLGTFPQYKDIPDLFGSIRAASKKKVKCKFNLRAQDQGAVFTEYYGLRKNQEKKRLEKVFEAYRTELLDKYGVEVMGNKLPTGDLGERITALKARIQDRTVFYKEYIGVDKHDAGCIFETEVEISLNAPVQLQLNVPYTLYNKEFNNYLAADTIGSYNDRFFGFLFYTGLDDRIAKWSFRLKGDRKATGPITKNMELELSFLDINEIPIAVVQRFTGDASTLLLSKYGVADKSDLTTIHNCFVEYC
ncbi:hypothetical protein ABW20_dc0108368 [Dactylellina cionopaga]|nr:hypothetical protein ABW20_dc0108368 [Dactylellina cionopaga]